MIEKASVEALDGAEPAMAREESPSKSEKRTHVTLPSAMGLAKLLLLALVCKTNAGL